MWGDADLVAAAIVGNKEALAELIFAFTAQWSSP